MGDSSSCEFWKNLDIHLNQLNAESKQLRRSALSTLHKEVKALQDSDFTKKCSTKDQQLSAVINDGNDSDDSEEEGEGQGELCPDEETKIPPGNEGGDVESGTKLDDIQGLVKPLLLRLSDPVEACRELAYGILTTLSQRLPCSSVISFLPHTIPILLDRLGGVELTESSEEVRLVALTFMSSILTSVGQGLAPFVDDWIRILSVTLSDPFHEVRKASCELISGSGKVMPHVFHYNSERLNKPLVESLVHQQSKVRLAVVRCIGDVLLFGNHKCIEGFILPLTMRLFDSQPNVRKAVVEVVGSWMLDYVDRYSYFHKLLPILLSGLCDECDAVQDTANKIWEKVGEKYLEENIQEYKDQVDFPSEMPPHYPDNVKRPNFGCRLLTQRHVGKIIPGVTNDISDWVETTRIKCAQLLFHLILNCEDNITMHTEQTFQCIFKSCGDNNRTVSNYVLKSAKLLGYFVPFPVAWAILSNRLSSNCNENCLIATAAFLGGCSKTVLKSHLGEISAALSNPDICHTLKSTRQFWILEACHSLTISQSFLEEEDLPGAENLFRILLSVLAMTADGDVKARAIVGLNHLKLACGYEQLDDVFIAYSGGVLQDINASDCLWSRVSPENLLFSAILVHGGAAVERHLNIILEILVKELDPCKEPEVRLNLFTLLSDVLASYGSMGNHHQQLDHFVTTIVEDILNPNLVWRAGSSACALRAAASSCLLIIVEQKLLGGDSFDKISSSIVTGCLGMLEERSELNRLLSTQVLGRIGEACEKGLNPELIHKVYPELLKRLDDEKDEVRVSSALSLSRIFGNVSPDYDVAFYRSHLEFATNALLLHLDDEEENVQAAVAEAIKAVGALDPRLVIEKCLDFKDKHRSPVNCENLVEYFKALELDRKSN